MAKLLLGKEVNASINEEIKAKVEILKAQNITPTLGIIRIGEREDDIAYERGATKRCETLGVAYEKFLLPADAEEEEVVFLFDAENLGHKKYLFKICQSQRAAKNKKSLGEMIEALPGCIVSISEGFIER